MCDSPPPLICSSGCLGCECEGKGLEGRFSVDVDLLLGGCLFSTSPEQAKAKSDKNTIKIIFI